MSWWSLVQSSLFMIYLMCSSRNIESTIASNYNSLEKDYEKYGKIFNNCTCFNLIIVMDVVTIPVSDIPRETFDKEDCLFAVNRDLDIEINKIKNKCNTDSSKERGRFERNPSANSEIITLFSFNHDANSSSF